MTGLRIPKDVNISAVAMINSLGESVDLYKIFNTIHIYEDLLSPFMTADIMIDDGINLQNFHKIVGGEEIIIVYRTPLYDENVTLTFKLFKTSEKVLINSKRMLYTFHCISREGFNDMFKKVSRSYNGISNLAVRDLLENTDYGLSCANMDKYEEDESEYEDQVVLPFQRPSEAIKFFSARSFSNSVPGFIFYETRKGFRYKNIDVLQSEESKTTYYYSGNNFVNKTNRNNIDFLFNSIESYSILESTNVLDAAKNGVYAGQLITYDPINKLIARQDFDYHKNFGFYNTLESGKLISDDGDASAIFYNHLYKSSRHFAIRSSGLYSSERLDEQINETLLKRNSLLNSVIYNRLNIKVPGDSERIVGDVVRIALLSPEESDTPKKDEFLYGKFLVTAIKHIITKEKYEMDMEVSKDSFASSLDFTEVQTDIIDIPGFA